MPRPTGTPSARRSSAHQAARRARGVGGDEGLILRCNGLSPTGRELRNNFTPTRGGLAIDAPYAAKFAADLQTRGVDLYEPGNEPALWASTHRDLHRNFEFNDELISKFTAVAAAVKGQQPAAEIVGPSEWGWIGYFCDQISYAGNGGLCNPPQGSSPGTGARAGEPLTPAVVTFLDAMRTYQEQKGVRLLDYFDLHYYPQAEALSTDETRSLWDPTYTDPSYIDSVIRLIPRMHEWVDQHYPGTKLAITEYNFDLANANPTLGAVMQADALGIFARERVDLATMFDGPNAASPVADAFRLYRNYDGAGGRFGTTYVRSTSEDQGRVAVYGSLRADGALTVAAVNKATTAQTSALSLAGFSPGASSQVWQSVGSGIVQKANVAITGGAIVADLPARSMTLFVVPPAAGGGGPGARDTTAPRISSPSLIRTVFAVDPAGRSETAVASRARRVARGTTFAYRLSEAARVLFTIQRPATGRRVGNACQRPSRQNRLRRKCTRYIRVGAFAQTGVKGQNRKRWSGKIGRRSLAPGRYRASLTARDGAGNRSKVRLLSFRIVRP